MVRPMSQTSECRITRVPAASSIAAIAWPNTTLRRWPTCSALVALGSMKLTTQLPPCGRPRGITPRSSAAPEAATTSSSRRIAIDAPRCFVTVAKPSPDSARATSPPPAPASGSRKKTTASVGVLA